VSLGRQLSVLSAKLIVFAFVVFALLFYHRRLRALVFGPVPAEYHEIIETAHERVRGVLYGHYVLVLVGAAVTYVLGLGLFVGLDYQIPFALALVAAVMWILPFISASPLVLAMTGYHALSGELGMAVAVGVLGAIFLIAVPNALTFLVWQRLGRPERLSSSLYFVGFVGGGLSFGLVGLVAGPLALGILSSLMGLLAEGAPGGNQFAGETDDGPEN
jgi:predicted PurR-regulated permease PerM